MTTSTNVPSSFLAKLFDISARRIQQLAKEGVIPKSEDGQYPLLGSVKGYVKNLQASLKGGGKEHNNISEARLRVEIAKAERAELEVAKLKSEVVLADDVKDEWLNMVSNFRARMLTLPSTIAAQGEGATRSELQEIAEKLVYKSLKELSEGLEDEPIIETNTKPTKAKTNSKGGGKKRKTTAKTNSKPVG